MNSGRESDDRQRWLELKELFNAAVELPPSDWPAFVRNVRDRDSDLADQLQRLIDGHVNTLIPTKPLRLHRLAPGVSLGPYLLTDLIGEGGMGQVYRAQDTRLGREVAIKVLPPELAHDSDRRARMEREARAMGMLNHPNVVTVYDIGDHHGSPFIVSELLEGRTLREEVAARTGSGSALDAPAAVDIVIAVADALGAAHRRGIVHRDIKPENIVLTEDGRIKVLDFGIAKLVDAEAPSEASALNTVIGTVGYMTPEQLRGETPCAQTDVYACGVVLFELLSGKRPHEHKSHAALIGAILHEPPAPLVDVPPLLSALVARCLDKRAEARFADGAELAAELRALNVVERGAVRAQFPRAQDRPKPQRGRPLLVTSVGVLLAIIAIAGLIWRQQREGSLPPPSPAAQPEVVLPAPSTSPLPSTVEQGRREPPPETRPPASRARQPRENPAAATGQPRPTVESAPAVTQPALPPPAVPTLSGVWTVSEQIAEDVQAIECAASGALQLTFNDGLLDGTLRLKRDCKDGKRNATDSTESTAAISGGTSSGDAVSFGTRVVDEGLTTTCKYSGQVVGSSKGAMAGEVVCHARSVGLSSELTLRGTWRASRTSP
jgi:serine/threonine protein kinase